MEQEDTFYKITIYAKSKFIEPGRREFAGVPLTKAWWGALKYWMTNRLSGEGLKIGQIRIEKVTEDDTVKV